MELDKGKNVIEKFINTKKMEKLTFWVMINIFYILIGSYFSTVTYGTAHTNFAYGLIPLLFINIIIGIVICKKGYCKKNLIYILMILIIFFGIIATIFAINFNTSLFGLEYRNEGLFSIMYYFSLMFLCSFIKNKHKKTIIFFIFIVGIINCIYGTIEVFGKTNAIKAVHPSENPNTTMILEYTWAKGLLINPNFFGTYMLLCLTYSIGLFIDEKSRKASIIYIILSVIFMYGLLISNSVSVAVGLSFALIVSLVYCIKNKIYKKFLILIIALASIFALALIQGKTDMLKDLMKTGEEAIETAKGNGEDTYGTSRLYIWKNTMQIVPKYLLHGAGIDNFYYAFGDEPLYSPGRNTYYDKAHNEYLQILVTEGIFCLAAYLTLYAIVTYRGIKISFKNKQIYLVLPIIGYLVQAFFNVSVIEVAPIFFIAMGLSMNNKTKEENKIIQK